MAATLKHFNAKIQLPWWFSEQIGATLPTPIFPTNNKIVSFRLLNWKGIFLIWKDILV